MHNLPIRLAAITCALASWTPCAGEDNQIPASQSVRNIPGEPTKLTAVVRTSRDLAVPYPVTQLQGIVLPTQDAQIKPTQIGRVAQVFVNEGDVVRKGEPLFAFESKVARCAAQLARRAAEATGDLEVAQLRAEEAQAVKARVESAYKKNASSDFELQTKQNLLQQALAAVQQQRERSLARTAESELAQARLDALTIFAPFDGEVLKLNAKVGNSLAPDQVAVRISAMQQLFVELHLPSSGFTALKPGQRYTLRTRGIGPRKFSAVASYVSPVIEPTSRTVRVRLEIDNTDRTVTPGTEVWLVP